jgi:hypothetical protein
MPDDVGWAECHPGTGFVELVKQYSGPSFDLEPGCITRGQGVPGTQQGGITVRGEEKKTPTSADRIPFPGTSNLHSNAHLGQPAADDDVYPERVRGGPCWGSSGCPLGHNLGSPGTGRHQHGPGPNCERLAFYEVSGERALHGPIDDVEAVQPRVVRHGRPLSGGGTQKAQRKALGMT